MIIVRARGFKFLYRSSATFHQFEGVAAKSYRFLNKRNEFK